MKNVNQKNVKYTANARIHNTRNEIEREERESELKKKKTISATITTIIIIIKCERYKINFLTRFENRKIQPNRYLHTTDINLNETDEE